MKSALSILLVTLAYFSLPQLAISDEDELASLNHKVDRLEQRINTQTRELVNIGRIARNSAPLLFLFGAFCALWAQNTSRNPWLWFFLGAFFSVFTVLFVLSRNRGQTSRQVG